MNFLRENLRDLKPYHSAYVTEGLLLNANESPYPVPQELVDYMKDHIDQLLMNRYPDTDSRLLLKAIAKTYGVDEKNVVCGVGSDELIDCILEGALEVGDQVLVPYPSFSMYDQFTLLKNGKVIRVPLTADFQYDFEGIKKAILRHQPKVIFLCNPNNPTGCILTPTQIEEILQIASGLVVVDEAYEDFSSQGISVISLIETYPHLIVLRTFSKAYALAGIRVGYAIACKEQIEFIHTVKAPYNLNLFSQLAATWAIEHNGLFKANAGRIIEERKNLEEGLRALGFKTYPSEANFIWLEMPDAIFEKLAERKIYIRKMTVQQQLYYRISIGTPEENKVLLDALKEMKP